MTRSPFKAPLSVSHLSPYIPFHFSIKIPPNSFTIRFLCKPSPLSIMAGKPQFVSAEIDDPNSSKPPNFPTPVSPPLPQISKDIELRRAMTASAKSSLFAISSSEIVFEDEFLIVVNKPSGIYCESLLSSIPHLLNTRSNSTETGKVSIFLLVWVLLLINLHLCCISKLVLVIVRWTNGVVGLLPS